jgi:hypothetical protein
MIIYADWNCTITLATIELLMLLQLEEQLISIPVAHAWHAMSNMFRMKIYANNRIPLVSPAERNNFSCACHARACKYVMWIYSLTTGFLLFSPPERNNSSCACHARACEYIRWTYMLSKIGQFVRSKEKIPIFITGFENIWMYNNLHGEKGWGREQKQA